MNSRSKASLSLGGVKLQWQQCWFQIKGTLLPTESADYRNWRHQFLYKRLGFGLWIGLICFLISSSHGLYIYVIEIEQLRSDFDKFYGEPWLADHLRDITIIGFFLIVGLIIGCLLMHRSRWGKCYPATIFLIFAGSVNGFVTQLIATFYDIPAQPSTTVFLAFAVLLPLRWPLHLLSQLLPITYYTVVLPLLGITEVGNLSIFDSIYSLGTFIKIAWVCLICNVGVYVYERLRRSEFESRRELKIFLHAISHDLRSPVMGTAMVTRRLLNQADDEYVKVGISVLERLAQGSDRQLALINALVEAYHADGKGITLHCQPLQLSKVVDTVLADVEPRLRQNQVELHNTINAALPLVNADPTHLWRVFSNLVDNTLKHNPPGIKLILKAEVVKNGFNFVRHANGVSLPPSNQAKMPMLLCSVQDNGIGIPREQCHRLFELYTRGNRARYMPGLGLGLYLCQQIVTAHGGQIGVVSEPNSLTIFWFTLPLATTGRQEINRG
ncbi:MAG: sensor histidine kinase [Cyanophyceae cyanobacterium]